MTIKLKLGLLSLAAALAFSAVHAQSASTVAPSAPTEDSAAGDVQKAVSEQVTSNSVGLTWEKTEISQILPFGQTSAELSFPFTNHSKSPVAILEVTTTCGCLSVTAPSQRVYAPGEKGEVKGTFTLGRSSGGQEKLIHVTTSDNLKKPIILKARVILPKPATPALTELEWKLGEDVVEKNLKIDVIPKATLSLHPLSPEQQKLISLELTPIRDTSDPYAKNKPIEAYLLKVRPVDPNRPLHLPLDILVTVDDKPQNPLTLFLHVQ